MTTTTTTTTTAPTRIRARQRDGLTEIVFLMPHPMETGLRKKAEGGFVPAHFISDVRVSVEGRRVFEARLTAAIARDPLLTVRCRGARVGDRVTVEWIDTRGARRTDSSLIV